MQQVSLVGEQQGFEWEAGAKEVVLREVEVEYGGELGGQGCGEVGKVGEA